MRNEIGFWCLVAGIVAVVLGLIVFGHLSCGPSPYPPCNQAQANTIRCSDDMESVVRCDGENWLPSVLCGETYNSQGEYLEEVCVESKEGPACQSEK